jgi:hypothetical protein
MRNRVTMSSSNRSWYHTKVAQELLESVSAEERGDEGMAPPLTPVHLRARQTVDAHVDVHPQEGVQLCGGSRPPLLRRCSIGVLRELFHQAARQEELQQGERRRVCWRRPVLQMPKTRKGHLDVVQLRRPAVLLLVACWLLLLLFFCLCLLLCVCLSHRVCVLIVALPAAGQGGTQRSGHIPPLEARKHLSRLLLCETEGLLPRAWAAAGHLLHGSRAVHGATKEKSAGAAGDARTRGASAQQ